MKLEEKLIYLRKKQGLSQLQLAEMMDISRQAVSRWETGSAVPSTENLKILSERYGVSLDYLLNEGMEFSDDQEERHEHSYTSESQEKKQDMKKYVIVAAGIALFIAAVAFYCNMSHESTEVLKFSDMECEYWGQIEMDEFSLTW